MVTKEKEKGSITRLYGGAAKGLTRKDKAYEKDQVLIEWLVGCARY